LRYVGSGTASWQVACHMRNKGDIYPGGLV
jgi:hypothetical protein